MRFRPAQLLISAIFLIATTGAAARRAGRIVLHAGTGDERAFRLGPDCGAGGRARGVGRQRQRQAQYLGSAARLERAADYALCRGRRAGDQRAGVVGGWRVAGLYAGRGCGMAGATRAESRAADGGRETGDVADCRKGWDAARYRRRACSGDLSGWRRHRLPAAWADLDGKPERRGCEAATAASGAWRGAGAAMVAGRQRACVRKCARRPQLCGCLPFCDEDAYVSCAGHLFRQ